MIYTELTPGVIALKDDDNRPPGLHLSQVVTDLAKCAKPDIYGKPLDDHGKTKIRMGLSFEEALEKSFQSAAIGTFRPPPVFVPPGIWCSPDGVDPESWSVEEFKLTWYSAHKVCPIDPVYWAWIVQIKGYCKAIDSLQAKLWVLYINGDYAPPRPWPPRVFLLKFTELEIEENWDMIVNHAKFRGWL